jgi:hypothetical protein
VLSPSDALVTGYDFLIDQADAISATLTSQGITDLDGLIDNDWTASDLRDHLFTAPVAPDLNSLNSHFQHYRLFPNDPTDIFATEVTGTTNYSGTLAFSVGCHSGLNVPDEDAVSPQFGTDWAQAFLRQGATFIGNTGYGYGDSDLIAYSERVMTYFVEELGYWAESPPTVGHALLRAKQRYYNTVAAASLSNYDEKILGVMALYGLPMLQVHMPITTTVHTVQRTNDKYHIPHPTSHILTSTANISFNYISHTVEGLGTYYTVAGENDIHVTGGRPVQPRTSRNIHLPDTIAHGALMVGGTFSDQPVDPVISRVVTEELYLETEPSYPVERWYPSQLGTVNRFLAIDGQSRERLVVVPGQFTASSTATPTMGTQRLYSELVFEIYHAPFTATDFIAPSIWRVEVITTDTDLTFRVLVEDDSEVIQRTVVLYRPLTSNTWSRAELAHDTDSGWVEGSILPVRGGIEYFAQAVDPTGNVALALDHGAPFLEERTAVEWPAVYLPLVTRSFVVSTHAR